MLTEGNHVKPRSGSQVGANMREENKEYIHYLSMVSSQPCVGPDEQERGTKPEPEWERRQNHPVQDEKMDDTFTKLAKSVVMILSIFLPSCIFKDLPESWLVGLVFPAIKWLRHRRGVSLTGDIDLRTRAILCGMWMLIFHLRRHWGSCVKVLCLWSPEYSYLIHIMAETRHQV